MAVSSEFGVSISYMEDLQRGRIEGLRKAREGIRERRTMMLFERLRLPLGAYKEVTSHCHVRDVGAASEKEGEGAISDTIRWRG